jgi:hypothetical protein
MTRKRDLKKRVRARQAQTGEPYTTALRQVLVEGQAARPEPVPVVELHDLSAAASALGLACRAAMVPSLVPLVDGAVTLAAVRTALLATDNDPSTQLLRDVVLAGRRPDFGALVTRLALAPGRRFLERARAGITGPSPGGHMLALFVDARGGGKQLVVALLWVTPVQYGVDRPPALILCGTTHIFDESGWGAFGMR